jgi:hypothetical protein
MRRALRIAALLACLLPLAAASGCGGGGSSDPLDTALAYLPKDAPFALAIDTDLDGKQLSNLRAILDKFPFGNEVERSLRRELEQGSAGVDFDTDVRPLLGNPFVVGATSVASVTGVAGDDDFVGAMEASDEGKLDHLIEKTNPDKRGAVGGAKLYEDDGTVFAVKEDVVVFAGGEELLKSALKRADGDDHLDEATFDNALEGLPDDALARVYADVGAIVAGSSDARGARKVKWVDALRTLGLTAAAKGDGLEVQFDLRTDSSELTEADLPIVAGAEAPPVVERPGEIGFGIRDPSQIVKFAETAEQSVDPAGFGQYVRVKKTFDKQLGVSIDHDLIGQLTGDLAASASVDGKFGMRAELEDPAAFGRTLAKLADVLPSAAEGAGAGSVTLAKPKGTRGFYALVQPDGDAVVFGVANGAFVLATDRTRAARLARAGPVKVPGARGSVVLSAAAQQLASRILRKLAPELGLGGVLGGQLFTGPLGDLTGSISASTEGLKGKLSLEIE